ncbi:unnamed protein product [Trifolium pratense]|nr:unnamed protein product [Trifolium pratense]
MNGIGKTTIAEEVYSRLCSDSDYEGCYFKANVREESRRHGIMSLKEELYSTLLGEQDLKIDTPDGLPDSVKSRLIDKKVLFVLDDVNDLRQLETLIGSKLDLFGNGSRIIITSRDKQVLAGRVDDIYEVMPLEFNDSLRLFNINAFEKNHKNNKEYKELPKMMVKYAEGIPLVLKVLGRLLRGKDKEVWEDYLGRFRKNIPIKIVHQIFRSSYNDLNRHEKKIFLDIGCFFNGLSLKVDDIQLLVKDHDNSMHVELESLKNKALITISHVNVVAMHNIIKQSALEIVREESNGDYEKKSRLMDPDDIYDVLKNNKGSEAIRSLAIDVSIIKELQLHPKVFAKMKKLQYLDIYSKEYSRDFVRSRRGLYLPQGLESFPNELRYLRWAHFPFASLPFNFSGEKLVVLDLQYSYLTQLWHEDYKVKQYASTFEGSSSFLRQDLANLKYLKLDSSTFLVELPDLSNATNLEVIDLRLCTMLKNVHPSVFTLNKLKKLDLGGCFSLESFESDIHLTSLRYLSLASCTALKEFSVTSKEMVKLNLERTCIKQLPSSIKLQTKLEKLLLAHSYIENLPESIKNLTSLSHLGLQNCSKLRRLPELPPSLIILDASGCVSLENVNFPSTAHQMLKENKTRVAFWNCLKLNQHSLNAIRLNAQINMMKFTHQHISISRDHEYDAQGTYVYPGSNVPEWLLYRTTRDSMTIDLSFGNHSSPLGFIFCFIVPQVPSEGFILRFNIEIDEGEEDIQLYLDKPRHAIKSDHVYLLYDRGFSRYLNSRVKDQPKFKIKVTAESQTLTRQYVPLMMLKGFAVSPINTSQYLNFVQHLEMAEDPSILSSSISIVNILLLLVFILLLIRMFVC